MKITLSNIGPIKKASVELDNLTIFVGENGTGKTIAAKVIYGLLSFNTRLNFLFHDGKAFIEKYQNELFGLQVNSLEELSYEISKLDYPSTKKIVKILENDFIEFFNEFIHKFFNEDPELFTDSRVDIKHESGLNEETFLGLIAFTNESLEKSILEVQNGVSANTNKTSIRIVSFFDRLLTTHLFGTVLGDASYLPAARSNFLLTYKACESALKNPNLDNVNSHFDLATDDFVKKLGSSKDDYSYLRSNVQDIEKDFFSDGNLVIDEEKNDFSYVLKDKNRPIKWHNISSMIGEITPLVLTMRSVIHMNSVLIIDEPESHLHPHAQKKLIDHIAMAVNRKVRIIVITHSPYVLSCINNLIKWGTILNKYPEDKNVKKLLKDQHKNTALDINIVKAFKFANGKTKPIINKKVNLIDESEFTHPFDLINSQYEAMRSIEWNHREIQEK